VRVLAERIRVAISEYHFETDMVEGRFHITCSFGCAEMDPTMTSEDDLMEAADRDLYAAKNRGRNRVGT